MDVIPHGVWARSEALVPPQSRSVLLFGRLEEYKGVEVLVAAMDLVWERRPDVKLVVAGAGAAARHVPDKPRVSLIPRYISESEVDTLLAEASLVALPYTQASQSGVGTLAIAAGVPVVVSDLGALPQLTYEPSYVFEAGNPRALAETIVRHVDHGPEVRSAVLRHAQAHFSWDYAARLTTELYRELAAQVIPPGASRLPIRRSRSCRPSDDARATGRRTSQAS
jgi:glycosyltransferase involved in cell wall biosynthesis